jgi:hypothetical protein
MYDLDRLDAVHHQMEENELSQAMDEIGYQKNHTVCGTTSEREKTCSDRFS